MTTAAITGDFAMHFFPIDRKVVARWSGLVAIVGALVATAAPAAEENSRVGVSIDATVLTGFGLSVGMPLGSAFNLRLVGNGYSRSRDVHQSSGDYAARVKLLTAGLLADWQPFAGAFRVTTGLLDNGNRVTFDGEAAAGGNFQVGDCQYTSNPTDPLSVHGQTNFRHLAPYLGIGWGGNLSAGRGFYATFDVGAIASGAANATLIASGSAISTNPAMSSQCGAGPVNAANDPAFQSQLAKAQQTLNDKADRYKFLPAVGLGLGWRF